MLFRKTSTAEISAVGRVSIEDDSSKFPYLILKPISKEKVFRQFFENDNYTGIQFRYLSALRKASIGLGIGKLKMAIVIDPQEHLSVIVGMMLKKRVMIAMQDEKNRITLDIQSAVKAFEPTFSNKILEDYLLDHTRSRNQQIEDMDVYKSAVLAKLQEYWIE